MDYIDKTNPTPLYYQLQQMIKEKIEGGVWKPGETIPTENELVNRYGISRSTVRQAILALVNDGYLRREKSKGTLVISPTGRKRFVGSLISFTSEMNQKGIPHFSKILSQKVTSADKRLAAKLDLAEGDALYYLKRVRYVSDVPFLLDEHYIPYHLCPGIETVYRENTSLYQLLTDQYHFNLHHGQLELEPINPPNKEVIDLLEIHSNKSLICAERIVYSEREEPLDYYKAIIRGKFSINTMNSSEFPSL